MTATMIGEYGHPRGPGHFVFGKGSTQILDGGNVFSCWVDGLLQSEHSSDGTLLMEAHAKQGYTHSHLLPTDICLLGIPDGSKHIAATSSHSSVSPLNRRMSTPKLLVTRM